MSLKVNTYEDYSSKSLAGLANWRALQIFSAYRLFIALSFLVLVWFNISQINSGNRVPELSLFMTLFYCIYSLGIGFINYTEKELSQSTIYIQQLVDLFVMILLLSNNHTMVSSICVLMTINIAAISLLSPMRVSFFFAATVTLMLFAVALIRAQATQFEQGDFVSIALHGCSYFFVAGLGSVLVQRLHSTEAMVNLQQYNLRSLEQLNAQIIDRLRSGVIVVDHIGHIQLMNQAAMRALSLSSIPTQKNLSELSPELFWQLIDWKNDGNFESKILAMPSSKAMWLPNFVTLTSEQPSWSLIFLEDTIATAKQAQQMKLASLGRFTASIAHEIRNPLGAISHAAQLLIEKPDFTQQELRLLEIINVQTEKMNTVIKNILNLTRRQQAFPSLMHLEDWLPEFIDNYQSEQYEPCQIQLELQTKRTAVHMDGSQLQQVLTNLLNNGLRASMQNKNKREAKIRVSQNDLTEMIVLDVLDQGPGLSVEAREKIFEPFFTEQRSGHGLGLYIAAELCLANQARLEAVEDVAEGACFRIHFQRAGGLDETAGIDRRR